MDEPDDQNENSIKETETKKDYNWLAPYRYKKGQSGNPNGRPAGKSLKEYAKEKLAAMTDEEREDFLNGIDKRVIWEMTEGKPIAEIKGDLNLKVEKLEAIQDATKQILGQ